MTDTFTVPVIMKSADLGDAIVAMADAKARGVLVRADKPARFRLVEGRDIIEAFNHDEQHRKRDKVQIRKMANVKSVHVADLGRTTDRAIAAHFATAESDFVVESFTDTAATVVSMHESLALPYSAGGPPIAERCKRPNKPAGTPNDKHYHYFPPRKKQPSDTVCPICRAPFL